MTIDLDRLLHPDEAREIVLGRARRLAPEAVPLEEAGERVLADDLVADVDLPPFPAAMMDGFAVVHDDAADERVILGTGFAGDDAQVVVTPGTAARIMTGAPVPTGATAVVQVENTTIANGRVVIRQPSVRARLNIREIGDDLRRGDLLVPAGTVLGPAEVGLLASLGHATVRVGRRPRVAVLSTGNEIVEPWETPGPGQIRDSNRFSLAVAARRAGAEVVMSRHARDELDELREVMRSAVEQADVLITSGGVSMGDRDLVKGLLGELAEVHFRRVRMKPGKPLNFASVGDKLLFGLPGNPVSCLVGFYLFVQPALRVMQGAPPDQYARAIVTLDHEIMPGDRIEYQRAVVWTAEDGTLHARNTGPQMSARLMSFAGANAFIVVPLGKEPFRAGDRLPAIMLAPPVAPPTS